jgi:hypothetical protein
MTVTIINILDLFIVVCVCVSLPFFYQYYYLYHNKSLQIMSCIVGPQIGSSPVLKSSSDKEPLVSLVEGIHWLYTSTNRRQTRTLKKTILEYLRVCPQKADIVWQKTKNSEAPFGTSTTMADIVREFPCDIPSEQRLECAEGLIETSRRQQLFRKVISTPAPVDVDRCDVKFGADIHPREKILHCIQGNNCIDTRLPPFNETAHTKTDRLIDTAAPGCVTSPTSSNKVSNTIPVIAHSVNNSQSTSVDASGTDDKTSGTSAGTETSSYSDIYLNRLHEVAVNDKYLASVRRCVRGNLKILRLTAYNKYRVMNIQFKMYKLRQQWSLWRRQRQRRSSYSDPEATSYPDANTSSNPEPDTSNYSDPHASSYPDPQASSYPDPSTSWSFPELDTFSYPEPETSSYLEPEKLWSYPEPSTSWSFPELDTFSYPEPETSSYLEPEKLWSYPEIETSVNFLECEPLSGEELNGNIDDIQMNAVENCNDECHEPVSFFDNEDNSDASSIESEYESGDEDKDEDEDEDESQDESKTDIFEDGASDYDWVYPDCTETEVPSYNGFYWDEPEFQTVAANLQLYGDEPFYVYNTLSKTWCELNRSLYCPKLVDMIAALGYTITYLEIEAAIEAVSNEYERRNGKLSAMLCISVSRDSWQCISTLYYLSDYSWIDNLLRSYLLKCESLT